MSRAFYWLLLSAFFFLSCRNSGMHEHAFYYWKTTVPADTAVNGSIRAMGVNKFYIRYFDVDWSETHNIPVPKGELTYAWGRCLFLGYKYVPVVFITNRTLEQMSDQWCDTLAVKISNKVKAITTGMEQNYVSDVYYKEYGSKRKEYSGQWADSVQQWLAHEREQRQLNSELQIDCDWTAGTKDKYFRLLKKIKELNPGKTLSVTVRMYPYKYRDKAGVPPADKAMLMCYNLGQVQRPDTRNSILDVSVLKQYMGNGAYPLPVDVALPVFSWYAWFRGDKFMGIIHEDEGPGNDTVDFKRDINMAHRYIASEDIVMGGNYIREGDVLRREEPSQKEIEAAAGLVDRMVGKYGTITFFDWNEQSTVKYEKAIHEVFSRY